jgi:hypothetical protein
MAEPPELVKPGAAQRVLALACALLLIAKVWLIPRLNIDSYESHSLSTMHASGELTEGPQTTRTNLFA